MEDLPGFEPGTSTNLRLTQSIRCRVAMLELCSNNLTLSRAASACWAYLGLGSPREDSNLHCDPALILLFSFSLALRWLV